MKFIDLSDDRVYTLSEIRKDWEALREEDPDNYPSDFKTELFEILMATVNGRNDLEIVGPNPREVNRLILKLRARLLN